MHKQTLLITLVSVFFLQQISFSQDESKEVTMFIFGHSLLNHELQINETPSQETSVPHWIHFLSEAAGNQYKISGQYGFLPQHANLPPIAQWGFDFAEGAWESDYDPFAEAGFTHILLTPGNFIQWQAPDINYPYDDVSPVSTTNEILNWCDNQTEDLNFYIYENWPDMAPFLSSGFPPAITEWEAYNEFLQTDFASWFDDYYQMINDSHPDKCVKLIPAGRLISELLQSSPFNEININQLYEDDAPHGRPSIYFLASMVTYMAVYEEKTPSDYQPSSFIDPIIAENYDLAKDFFWEQLQLFNNDDGSSKTFCKSPTSILKNSPGKGQYLLAPNPTKDQFQILNLDQEVELTIYDLTGKLIKTQLIQDHSSIVSLQEIQTGIYTIKISNLENNHFEFFKIIKTIQ